MPNDWRLQDAFARASLRKSGKAWLLKLGALGLGLMGSLALAHPDGKIACSASLSISEGRPSLIALTLEVDAENSGKILAQQVIDPNSGELQGASAEALKNLLAKGFREQDWLLSFRAFKARLPVTSPGAEVAILQAQNKSASTDIP
jgi:hypothetical protein